MRIAGQLATTSLSMALLVAASVTDLNAQRVVPMDEEPRHRLVLDRPTFQIVDARIPAGDTTLFHTHDAPIHYVTINASLTTAQVLGQDWPEVTRGSESLRPIGSAFWSLQYARQPVTHRVANIGSGLFRLIAVTNLTAGRSSAAPDAAATATELPGFVEAESEWFRRARLTLQPGEQAQVRGTAARPVVAIQVSAGTLEARSGEVVVGTGAAAGDWILLEGSAAHLLRNAGPTAVTVVLVQIQSQPLPAGSVSGEHPAG